MVSAADRISVHPCDYGLGAGHDVGPEIPVVTLEPALDFPLHIAAGAEGAFTCAGEDNNADGTIRVGAADRIA